MQEYLGIVFWQFFTIFLNTYVNIREVKKFTVTNINVVAIIYSPQGTHYYESTTTIFYFLKFIIL